MKVLVASHTSDVFQPDGAADLAAQLAGGLVAAGHEAFVVSPPFDESPDVLLSQLATVRMIDLTDIAELVICLTPVAMLMRHPRKLFWADALLHDLSPDLSEIDARALAEMDSLYVQSAAVHERVTARTDQPCAVLPIPHDQDAWAAAVEVLVTT